MATTKKSTKSTAKKSTATKKSTAKKTTAAKSRYDSQTFTLREVTNSSLRALLIGIAIIALGSFFIAPYGTLVSGEKVVTGWELVSQAIKASTEGLMTKYCITNVIPVILLVVSAVMLLIRTDKFTAFMSIMISGIAGALFAVGYVLKLPLSITTGWELILLFIIIELLFSIALYVSSPSLKKGK